MDNIYASYILCDCLKSKVIITDISPHYPVPLIHKNLQEGPKSALPPRVKKRDTTSKTLVYIRYMLAYTSWSSLF